MRLDAYPYGPVAFCYDELASFYSRGRIAASKRLQVEEIEAGQDVLYAGVGRGDDALRAVRRGARVTAVDLAPEMLDRFGRRLAREGLEAELVQADVSRHSVPQGYDVVVANYFLNLFDRSRAEQMLRHLAALVRPGGRLMLADFARAEGGALARALTAAYYRPVNWIAWVLGLCALHPIFDHATMLASVGFEVRSERRLPVLWGRNPAYVSLVAERADRGGVASAG